MKLLLAGVMALSLGGLALVADDKKPESRAERLAAIQAEANAPSKAYQAALKEAGDDKDKRQKAMDYYRVASTEARAKAPDRAERVLALAKEDPKDETGLNAAIYAYTLFSTNPTKRAEAFQLIADHHVANPKIETLVPQLVGRPNKAEAAFLAAAREKNPSEKVKATIAFATAQAAIPKDREFWDVAESELVVKRKAAFAVLEKSAADFGDVEITLNTRDKGKVADLVKKATTGWLVGKVTPEIEGEDTDGAKFKLSDYRGKVVLIDFWGHW